MNTRNAGDSTPLHSAAGGGHVDVIEELLGLEVMDESDRVGDMQELARRSARRAGSRAAQGESHES